MFVLSPFYNLYMNVLTETDVFFKRSTLGGPDPCDRSIHAGYHALLLEFGKTDGCGGYDTPVFTKPELFHYFGNMGDRCTEIVPAEPQPQRHGHQIHILPTDADIQIRKSQFVVTRS